MAEESSQEVTAPRFIEMPQAIRLDVIKTEIGLGIDFTYQPPDKSDPITMRLPLTSQEARDLSDMLASAGQAKH